MFYFREYKCVTQQTGGWVGFDNYNIYGTVINSVSETSDLHLGMSRFCQIRFSRSSESGEVREEVDRGWSRANCRISGGISLLSELLSHEPFVPLSVWQTCRRCLRASCGLGVLVPSDRNELLGIIFTAEVTKYIILFFRSLDTKHIHYYLNNLLCTLSSGYQGYRKYL